MRFRGLLALLLRYEGYPPAVVVALLLHGSMVFFLLERDIGRTEIVNVERPPYVNAVTTQDNPQRLRRLEQLEQQRQAADRAERQRQQEAERQRQQEAERRRVEQEQQAARERAQREAQARTEEERRQRELAEQRERERQRTEAERQRQEQLAREQAAREQAAREQAARQAEAAAAQASASEMGNYTAIIRQTVEQFWVIPPSARNGMTAVVRIQLVPTGEVVDVRVVQSSGDPAFDRSVELAVRKAARFPELRGMDIALFEREFRTILLQFQPEDLLR